MTASFSKRVFAGIAGLGMAMAAQAANAAVDPSYGGENAPHRHDPREPGVDPSYGGDQSPGYLHRAGLDAKEGS